MGRGEEAQRDTDTLGQWYERWFDTFSVVAFDGIFGLADSLCLHLGFHSTLLFLPHIPFPSLSLSLSISLSNFYFCLPPIDFINLPLICIFFAVAFGLVDFAFGC